MAIFAVIFFIILFFIFKRFSYEYREAVLRKKIRLLETKNKLDTIACKMEEKLCAEEFKLGTPCHDIWFPIINKTRYADKYISVCYFICWLNPIYRKRLLENQKEMKKEVQKMHPGMKKLYDEYQNVLFEAFKIRHSVIFKMLVVIAILSFLPQIFKAIKSSQEIKQKVDWPQRILNFQLPA